jgi:hypothetical protein
MISDSVQKLAVKKRKEKLRTTGARLRVMSRKRAKIQRFRNKDKHQTVAFDNS